MIMEFGGKEIVLAVVVLSICIVGWGEIDIDGDGLKNSVEDQHGLDKFSIDTDGDGLNDSIEVAREDLDGSESDSDEDGLSDSKELRFGSDPSKPDTDGDGATDKQEFRFGSNPNAKHSDKDGVPDGVEISNLSDPTKLDTDKDGLPDPQEIRNDKTKPNRPDTDFDGLEDKFELEGDTDPNHPDTDSDGLNDSVEIHGPTDPTLPDTDGDGLEDGFESRQNGFDPTRVDTDGDGLNDKTEYEIDTDPANSDTDGDGRPDKQEYAAEGLDPSKVELTTISGSGEGGISTESLRTKTLDSVTQMGDLAQNRTEWNQTVTDTATTICNSHDEVVPQTASNITGNSSEIYRDTYRIQHAAGAMQTLGADLNVNSVENRMQTARRYTSLLSDYTPIVGSYQRLHNASCAVKQGKEGAKQDFYIASAEFTADIALAKEGVIYKASFKTTGMAARAVGLNRLSRICGYKCVGLVQSELHWFIRGTYNNALDTASIKAINGDVSLSSWNESVRQDVAQYVSEHTEARVIGEQLIQEQRIVSCVNDNLGKEDILTLATSLSTESVKTLRTVIEHQKLPEDVDLAFLEEIDGVESCLNGTNSSPEPRVSTHPSTGYEFTPSIRKPWS
ncbi:hypothetical protein [Haloarchaeobius amylolyticus]|uniref:hypothetical protein n=1 Tax=Haloarchaeobius amylolyticus TaxID=1198296 RepID=UPI00226DD64F|nr:hypothetical protein [Haloarchaeobius amylolyticus]